MNGQKLVYLRLIEKNVHIPIVDYCDNVYKIQNSQQPISFQWGGVQAEALGFNEGARPHLAPLRYGPGATVKC